MSITTDTQAKLDKARRLFESAQEAAQREADAAAAARQARLDAHDRALLDAFDDEQLGADLAQAQQDLLAAVEADGALGALARLYAARLRRTYRRQEAQDAAMRLGDSRPIPPPTPVSAVTVEELLRAVADVGEAINSADLQARDDARQAVAEGRPPAA